MDIPILAQGAAQQRQHEFRAQQQQQQNEEPVAVEATCAFIVYQTTEGTWVATQDLDAPVMPARSATPSDIASGCGRVKEDLLCRTVIEQTTLNILGNLQRMMTDPQIQMQAMQANEAARAAAAAANGKLGR